jgi:formylglycine-generating enzyme required for sulfatase activity
MTEVPFNVREVSTGYQKSGDAPSPTRRIGDEPEMLRRRLQYALDEIAHLTQALKEARGQEPGAGEGSIALRDRVETQQQALDRMAVELAAAAEEREHLNDQLQALAGARDEAQATAEHSAQKTQVLRQMIADLQRQLDAKTLELGGKNKERRRLAKELKRRMADIAELQHRLERQTLGTHSSPRDRTEPPNGNGGGLSVLTADLPPEKTEPRGDAPSDTEPRRARSTEDGLPGAPAPAGKLIAHPRPARQVSPLIWTLALLAVVAAVVGRWYAAGLGSDPPMPGTSPKPQTAAPAESARAPSAPLADAASTEEPASEQKADEPRVLPPRRGVRDRLQGGGLGPTMTAVGSGTFTMGSDAIRLHPDESPPHEVTVARFLIAVTEITYADYERFAQGTGARLPNDFGWGRGQHPVADVSWEDAAAYTQWLSRQTGRRYRLPSEAEWEYAARGDSLKTYWWGSEPEVARAVCFDCGTRWDDRKAAPVASLAPNPFGLYDTAGNVMEWVGDCWTGDYAGASADARTRTDGDCRFRVARGGAFNKPATAMRSAARYRFVPETRIDMLGFRVVREE